MNKLFYAGIKAAIQKNNQFLWLHKVGGYSDADLPGGRMQKKESPGAALIRELQEELPGIQNIEVGKLLTAFDTGWTLADGNGLWWMIYSVECDLPDPIKLSDEHYDYEWRDGYVLL
jgi:8-oxo-dGTP pyrophosphatase MutT (NUDIX family)